MPTYNLRTSSTTISWVSPTSFAATSIFPAHRSTISFTTRSRLGKPVYIHCPPVMRDAHNKLSKRSGDASYQDLVKQGYLSAAIINYLLLLGWGPKDDQEVFSHDEMIKAWNPTWINKAPAIFDIKKLRAINAGYINRMTDEDFTELARPWVESVVKTPIDLQLLCKNLPALR